MSTSDESHHATPASVGAESQDLYAALAELSLANPTAFAEATLDELRRRFELAAATLVLYAPDDSALRVRAQVGLDPAWYESFDIPTDTLAGEAARSNTPRSESELETSPRFRDKRLLKELGASSVAIVPLTASHESQPLAENVGSGHTIGVICMYPKNASRATEVMHQVVPYSSFIARLYLASLERTGMQIRQQVVENIAFAEDLNSLVEGFIPLLSGWLGVSDCRVWVHHPRRRQLYRVSAAAPTGQRKTLSLKDSRSPIVDCFETRTAVYLPGAAVDDEIANWAAIPIPLPEGTKLAGIPSKCAGVVELRDHVTRLGDVRETTSLSWEDRYVAHFAAELLAVLLYQAVRGADHDGEYDRNMHGAQTALQAARASLQLMERHLANPAFRAHSAENLLPNAIDWLRDLEMQVARDVLLARRPRPGERLALYGEVLAKIQPLASRLNTRSRSVTVRVHDIDQLARPDRFQRIPRVWADKEGLNMVFRNLIDNARKYGLTPGTKIADIRLAVDVSNEFVSVFFEDLGRGVEREERDLIFEDGYRGALAERRSTDGLGRGLFDCKRVLQSMGGELLLHGGTTGGAKFEVRLKRADRLNHERRTT